MDTQNDSTLSRRARKKRETRKRILDAAVALTSERAFSDVRIEDICAAADVANATFFLHFANKPALARAFGEEITTRLEREAQDNALTSSAQLEKLLQTYIDQWRNHRNLMNQVVLEFGARNGDTHAFNEVAPGLVALVGQTISRGQAEGQFSNRIEPKIASLALVAAWNAIAISSDMNEGASALRQTLDLFLAGLTSPQP